MFICVYATFRELVSLVQLALLFVIGNLLVRLSCANKLLVKSMHRAASVYLPRELYWDSLFSWSMVRSLWQLSKLDIRKTARRGRACPNPQLVDPVDGRVTDLWEVLVGAEKLHVLAFGSFSCPVFRIKLKELKKMAQEFGNVADFTVIYIVEAHPSDGWAFKDNVPIAKHKTIEDRLNAVQKLQELDKERVFPIYADSMKNESARMFGVNAIRLYMVQDQTIIYEGGIGPTHYNLDEVKHAIMKSCTLKV